MNNQTFYYPELCHFGERCHPGIIADEILNIRKKTLFMLGGFPLKSIIAYLNNENFEEIYEEKHLIPIPNDVTHSVYNFKFNHDYKVINGEITNYEHIKNRFDEKIKNFKSTLSSSELCVFLNFCSPKHYQHNILNNTLRWLEQHKPNFHLMLFTNSHLIKSVDSNNLSIIHLNKSLLNPWKYPNSNEQRELYEEIYNKFIFKLNENNISHNFPEFHNTYYGKLIYDNSHIIKI